MAATQSHAQEQCFCLQHPVTSGVVHYGCTAEPITNSLSEEIVCSVQIGPRMFISTKIQTSSAIEARFPADGESSLGTAGGCKYGYLETGC